MNTDIDLVITELSELFQKRFKQKPINISRLRQSGSSRLYFKIKAKNRTAIGTYNDNPAENKAFIYISEHFKNKGIPVPQVYSYEPEKHIYIQEDLGDTTLYKYLQEIKKTNNFESRRKELYKSVLQYLIKIQTQGNQAFDFSRCYPREAFDRQSISWDLNYFKYMFVKPAGINFDEQALEDDFRNFTDFVLQAPDQFFMFRDFQSRNIMFRKNQLFFIDFQGGRRGALQYDAASLLYDAKAELPENLRDELIDYYADLLQEQTGTEKNNFFKYYYSFVFLRIMQAMGAYGYRGLIENKKHFILSIAPAQENLKQLLLKTKLEEKYPEIGSILHKISQSQKLKALSQSAKLKVNISSFSYKRGIPYDATGNGGGFVFDCRFLNNPGRHEKYKTKNGKDPEVINFLKQNSSAEEFGDQCKQMLQAAVKNYIRREFSDLSIAFGCTGGQHRSVYLAEKLADSLKKEFDINVNLRHSELEKLYNKTR